MLNQAEAVESLRAPLDEVVAAAGSRRDALFGRRVTFSPKVFIPLTMLCRDRCGYCTFAKPPARLEAPFLTLDEVLGDRPPRRRRRVPRGAVHPGRGARGPLPGRRASGWPRTGTGRRSTTSSPRARAVLEETGLLPHANAGALDQAELERLRAVSPSQGMMIETLAARLGEPGGPHHGAPDKTPDTPAGDPRRRRTGARAVHHRHPRRHRRDAERAARRPARDPRRARAPRARAGGDRPELPAEAGHGDVRERPPCPPTSSSGPSPRPGSCSARRCTSRRPRTCRSPTTSARSSAAGIDDWGGVSPVTPDHVNPERPWPALDLLRAATEAAGKTLAPRLTVYPEYVRDAERWLHPDVRFPVLVRVRPRGPRARRRLGGRRRGGSAARCSRRRRHRRTARAGAPVGEVLDGVRAGEEVGVEEIVTLLGARGPDVAAGRRGGRRAAPRHRRRRRHVRAQPQHQLHERLHVQVPVLRLLEGPAVAEPAGRRRTCSTSRRSSAGSSKPWSAARPRSASRAASIPTSTATTTSTSPGR